jgi:hypothetical protein
MCFSPLASISTLVIGLSGAYLCYSLDTPTDKLVGLFFGFVSLMQGIEYLLWENQKCNSTNKMISLLGMILNHLQPVVLAILILVLNKDLDKNIKNKIISFTAVYIVVITFYSFQFFTNKECTIKNVHSHLEWQWNGMEYRVFVYLLFLFTLIYLFLKGTPNKKYGKILAIFTFVSYWASFFIYKDQQVIGSMWCLFASFAPVIWYFLRKKQII